MDRNETTDRVRKCCKCMELKPIWEFSRVPYIEGGRMVKCRSCESNDGMLWRAHTKDKRELRWRI